jgi:hypothetical protein
MCCDYLTNFFNRGADLINRNLTEQLLHRRECEQTILCDIKKKMARIKERHKHFQPPGYKEPTDHYEGSLITNALHQTVIKYVEMKAVK